MGIVAIKGIETPTNITNIGEARDSDIFIEAYRTPPINKNVVLAYKGDYNSVIYNEISKYDWDIETMAFILQCESSGNPRAIGDTNTKYHSYGLLQIRLLPNREYTTEELFNPERNIEAGYKIWQEQGYGAWKNCYRSYLKYL